MVVWLRSGSRVWLGYMKRVFVLLLCFVSVVGFMPVRSHALAPALLAAPEVAAVLTDVIVSTGVTVMAAEAVDHVVNDVWGAMSVDQQQALSDATYGGRWLIDAATGAYKYVVDVSDDLWQGVKTAVDGLFDAGENTLTEDGTSSVSLVYGVSGAVDTGWVVPSSLSPITVFFNDGDYVKYFISGDSLMFNLGSVADGDGSVGVRASGVEYLSISDTISRLYVSYKTFDGSTANASAYYKGTSDDYLCAVSYGSSIAVGTAYGDETAIDNPDYDYNNNTSGGKNFPFVPAIPAYDIPENGASDAIKYDNERERIVALNAQSLAAQDATGIDTSDERNPAYLDLPVHDALDLPETGSENNTSLKALFFSKFPFCLPWDIKNAFTLLLAPPEAPEWEIDLVPTAIKQQCGITANTKWEINMDDFQIVGQLSRWTATISFCIALIVLTRRIIHS